MSKITYLNSHLQKYRKEPEFRIDLEDIEALAYYDILVKEDKKTTKIFVKCLETSTTIPSPTHCPAREVPAVLGIKVILFLVANSIKILRSFVSFGKATASGIFRYTEASVA